MRWRWTTSLAFGLWLLMLVLVVSMLVMKALGWHGANNTSGSGLVALFFAFMAFATMGALVAGHVPRNPLGWLFLAIALGVALGGAAENVAFHGLVDDPGSVPGAMVFAWVYAWVWNPDDRADRLRPAPLPDGQGARPRWNLVLWALVAVLSLVTLTSMLYPGSLDTDTGRLPDNPIGVGIVGDVLDAGGTTVLNGAAFALVLCCAASVVVRFWRSRGDERQQLKWMTLAACFLAAGMIVADRPSVSTNTDIVFSLAMVQFPLAVGIALFKYRLYDIDRLINRTLVYAVVDGRSRRLPTSVSCLSGRHCSRRLPEAVELGDRGSTLVVAALFLPVRSQVQGFVDRRFYRRRYDAQRTLESLRQPPPRAGRPTHVAARAARRRRRDDEARTRVGLAAGGRRETMRRRAAHRRGPDGVRRLGRRRGDEPRVRRSHLGPGARDLRRDTGDCRPERSHRCRIRLRWAPAGRKAPSERDRVDLPGDRHQRRGEHGRRTGQSVRTLCPLRDGARGSTAGCGGRGVARAVGLDRDVLVCRTAAPVVPQWEPSLAAVAGCRRAARARGDRLARRWHDRSGADRRALRPVRQPARGRGAPVARRCVSSWAGRCWGCSRCSRRSAR